MTDKSGKAAKRKMRFKRIPLPPMKRNPTGLYVPKEKTLATPPGLKVFNRPGGAGPYVRRH